MFQFSGGIAGPTFAFDVGPTIGTLTFDAPSIGGNLDPNQFHFDHTTPVAGSKFDLYSVALHEILHTLGIGTAASWDANVSGSDWLGAEVIAILGDGSNLVAPGHVAENVIGLVNGLPQEVVMSPSIGNGERRFLTDVDLAFLRDVGWTTAAVPEPGSAIFLAMGGLVLRRRR